MNRILATLLIACVFSLPAGAKRNEGGSKESTRNGAVTPSGSLEATTPTAIQTIPAPTYRSTSATRTEATPFAAPTTTRTYVPSTPAYRSEPFKGRSEQSPSQSQRQTTREVNPTGASSTVQDRTPITPPTTPATSVSAEPVRRESHRVTSTRERNESLAQPARTGTTPSEENHNTFRTRERKDSLREPTQPGTVQQDITPNTWTKRNSQESAVKHTTTREVRTEPTAQREIERIPRERTARTEQPQRVQITPPSRTAPRPTVKVSTPFVNNERSSTQPEPTRRVSSMQHDRPQYELNTQRHPEPVRTTYHPPDTHNYHSRHYPTHQYNTYRPVTCYSGRDAFWNAFSFALVAPFVAPLYVAQVVDPFPVRTVTTTWQSGSVAVSVSSRSTYPVYTYSPYYCSSAWGHHDGWQHSNVYYGGWRSSWYGGFSYMFNPYPVYRSYYLYEEPQTIVIQQPAQQVVYINQPVQPVAPVQGSLGIFEPQQQPVATPPPAEAKQVEAAPEPCFCACKCNRRVPCICEYACGSEFNYSPEAYTLVDFISYSESLNAELIWSSYAELDRPEATDVVAEAGN